MPFMLSEILMRSRAIGAILCVPVLALLTILPTSATTLQKLTMSDLITQSTAIVRVKVTGASTALRGRDIYTTYQFQVLETLKGTAQTSSRHPGKMRGSVCGRWWLVRQR